MKDRATITSHVGTAASGCPVEQSSSRSLIRAPFEQLKSCAQIFFATMREIFDESAYARFLNQKQLVSSRAAYAAFQQENEAVKARRPKCC
jgi:hypothetical protein